MEAQKNSVTKKTIVSAKEARQRSVTTKLTQLEETIAGAIEHEVNKGRRTDTVVSVSGYSETVVSKAIASLRDQDYTVTVNRSSINLGKGYASSIKISWGE